MVDDVQEEDVDEDVQDDADEQPEIDDDEMADISAVAEAIEEETNADDDQDDSDDDVQDDDQDDASLDSPQGVAGDGTSVGDIYCNGLGMIAAIGRSQYGSAEEQERSDLVEEYGEIARMLEIDKYVDEMWEESGGVDELSPQQAVLVTTMMWGGMVAMDDPEMIDGIGGALNV